MTPDQTHALIFQPFASARSTKVICLPPSTPFRVPHRSKSLAQSRPRSEREVNSLPPGRSEICDKSVLSLVFRRVVVRRTGCRNAVCHLRPTSMRASQRRGKGYAGAGDLCIGFMRVSERCGNRDRGYREPADGGDNRRLGVRATVDRDGFTIVEANQADDRDDGRARGSSSAQRRRACGAHCRDDSILLIRTGVYHDRLAGFETRHAADFEIGRAGGRCDRQSSGGLRSEIIAVAAGVNAVREAARA